LVTEESSVALLRVLYHEAPRFPEIGRIFYETCILRGGAQLSAYLAMAHESGGLRVPDPPLAAEQFLNLCHAKLVMPLMLCVIATITPVEAAEIVDSAVSVFLAAHKPS
jgi:hypothetical protein